MLSVFTFALKRLIVGPNLIYHMFNSLDVPLSIGGFLLACFFERNEVSAIASFMVINLFGEAKRTAPWTKRITNATFLR